MVVIFGIHGALHKSYYYSISKNAGYYDCHLNITNNKLTSVSNFFIWNLYWLICRLCIPNHSLEFQYAFVQALRDHTSKNKKRLCKFNSTHHKKESDGTTYYYQSYSIFDFVQRIGFILLLYFGQVCRNWSSFIAIFCCDCKIASPPIFFDCQN